MAKLYNIDGKSFTAGTQLIPNDPKLIEAQKQFGWTLDRVYKERTTRGAKELAVLIRVVLVDTHEYLSPENK